MIDLYQGRAKTKIAQRDGNNTNNTYRGRALLFQERYKVHDGPMRVNMDEPYDVPFTVKFPPHVTLDCKAFEKNTAYATEPGHPLPPSAACNIHGFSSHAEGFVEYKLDASITMQNIDVDVLDILSREVKYCPASTVPASFCGTPIPTTRRQLVTSKEFLADDQRPTGFRQKTKAFIVRDFPSFTFNYILDMPQYLRVGTTPAIPLRIKPLLEEQTCTVKHVPLVHLTGYRLKLRAKTHVRCEVHFVTEHDEFIEETVWRYDGGQKIEAVELGKQSDWQVMLASSQGLAVGIVPPTFRTWNINWEYMIEVDFTLRIGGEKGEKVEGYALAKVVVLPLDRSGGPAEVGRSAAGPSDPLPTYHAAADTQLIESGVAELSESGVAELSAGEVSGSSKQY